MNKNQQAVPLARLDKIKSGLARRWKEKGENVLAIRAL